MSTVELKPSPVRVSPLIKFGRWSLLALGILYGVFHQRRYSRKENARRQQEEIERPFVEAKLAEENRIKNEAELKMLFEEIFKVKVVNDKE